MNNIEGTTLDEQLAVAKVLAEGVPEQGWIIEVGCFKGRQSVVLGKHKSDTVLLTCLDPFPDMPDTGAMYVYSGSDWLKNTQSLTNVEMAKGYSPINMKHVTFAKGASLVVIDMNAVRESLDFWKRFVVVGGKFLVHTYNEGGVFPEIENIVTDFASENINFTIDNLHYSVILTRNT